MLIQGNHLDIPYSAMIQQRRVQSPYRRKRIVIDDALSKMYSLIVPYWEFNKCFYVGRQKVLSFLTIYLNCKVLSLRFRSSDLLIICSKIWELHFSF